MASGFETGDFTGWNVGDLGSGMSTTSPLAGNYSVLQTPSIGDQLQPSFPPLPGPVTTTFIFSASDPGGAGDRSMNVTFRDSNFSAVGGGHQINLRLVDLDADGDGDTA